MLVGSVTPDRPTVAVPAAAAVVDGSILESVIYRNLESPESHYFATGNGNDRVG